MGVAFIFIAFLGVVLCNFTVKQQTAVIIERFGKFNSIRQAGLQFKIPFVDKQAGRLTLKSSSLM
jgi:regulator of protease activity HflC (stomatin/prohibitin superfamily)